MAEAQSPHPPAPPGEEIKHPLGLAGGMTKAFIHSPLSLLLYLAMLAMGIIGVIITPRQEDPQVSVPLIDVFVQFPGASAEEVASLALDPLQRVMSEIPGVKHVYSAAMREQGMIAVRFKVGEDFGESVVKVHDKVQSNMDRLAPGVSPPLVKPKAIDDVPVVTLTLWSKDQDDAILRRLATKLLLQLKQVEDTGQGFIAGGRADQIRVEVKPERLSGYGIGLDQVANTIRTANREQGVGNLERGNNYYKVYAGAFLKTAEDVSNLVIGSFQGSPVYVRDVADVSYEPQDLRHLVTYFTGPRHEGEAVADGYAAVTVAIAKKVGSNGVSVANDILAKVESLKGELIPDNVYVEVTRNYGKTANDKVNALIKKLFIATGAVTILVFFTLGWRPSVVVTLSIPVVLLMTVFSAWVMGYTIDRVSLFALIFSIGILVDDAIVVVENIYRRWLIKEDMDTETAIDAVREVGNPTILATFTVVAALLPMGAVRGLMGPYMEPIPALGSAAMVFSLFAAFVFVPWLAMRIRPSMETLKKAAKKEHAQEEKLDRLFRSVLIPLMDRKTLGYTFLIGVIVAFFASMLMFYTTAVVVKMLPFDNKSEFDVVIDMPAGTALGPTANLARQMADALREIPEVTDVTTYAGTAKPFDFNGMVRHYYLRHDPWQGEVHVELADKHERSRTSHQIAAEARKMVKPIAERMGARITVAEIPPGPPVIQSVTAEIYGPDQETINQVTLDVTGIFEQVPGLADVNNFLQAPHDVIRFEVDTDKAVRRGISVDTIVRNLDMAMGGFKAGDVKRSGEAEPTFITIEVPMAARNQTTRLGDLPIATPAGSTVPLTELGRFVKAPQDQIIMFKDLRRMQYVMGDAVGRLESPIYPMGDVQDLLDNYTTPDGVVMSGTWTGPPESIDQSGFEWAGEWTITYETFRDMGMAFGMALILIYMLLVSQFGNFIVPAVIMAPIPLTLLGIVPGHWVMGAQFTATSMIGFIALAGIIVRNSILLVDFAIETIEQGASAREAVILSCKARTRPIMITAFALVGGSMVILTDPIFQGMAVSLLFGVLVSTILTLVVIPLGCMSVADKLRR